jgi:NAD(P)-dependent dehydrogenase (short-subunit alcohol dehydrogenase family)
VDVNGAAALVTGGASGLGEATVRALANAGARVLLLDRDTTRGQAIVDEISGVYAPADVTDPDDVRAAVKQATALGPLRVAVNCAGIVDGARILRRDGTPHDLGLFQRIVAVNLIGTFNVLRLAAAAMAELDPTDDGERGVVINTASISGIEGQIGQAGYAASKAGVIGLTLAAARDLGSRGIRVVTIAPGIFSTPMLNLIPEPARETLANNAAFPQRPGRPAEYAALVLTAISNPYLNGETIRLDAGLRMTPK